MLVFAMAAGRNDRLAALIQDRVVKADERRKPGQR